MSSEENIVEFEVLDGAKTAGGMDAAGEADVTDSDVQLQAELLDEADVQGFDTFLGNYKKALDVERSAIKKFRRKRVNTYLCMPGMPMYTGF